MSPAQVLQRTYGPNDISAKAPLIARQERHELTEYIFQSMRDAAEDAADFLYALSMDTFPEDGLEIPIEYSTSSRGPKIR